MAQSINEKECKNYRLQTIFTTKFGELYLKLKQIENCMKKIFNKIIRKERIKMRIFFIIKLIFFKN